MPVWLLWHRWQKLGASVLCSFRWPMLTLVHNVQCGERGNVDSILSVNKESVVLNKKLLLMIRKKKLGGIIWWSNPLLNNRPVKLIGWEKQAKGFHVFLESLNENLFLSLRWLITRRGVSTGVIKRCLLPLISYSLVNSSKKLSLILMLPSRFALFNLFRFSFAVFFKGYWKIRMLLNSVFWRLDWINAWLCV